MGDNPNTDLWEFPDSRQEKPEIAAKIGIKCFQFSVSIAE
jgi:hypothetical protein